MNESDGKTNQHLSRFNGTITVTPIEGLKLSSVLSYSKWNQTNGYSETKQHELYNSGHLFEAAAAHYLATGKRNFLNIALKNADLLVKTFGPGKRNDAPGHEIVEMGLVRLYRITKEQKYLDLAKFFIDCRGKVADPKKAYSQDHKPLVQQDEAVGHAVRAGYLYSGVADVAALTGDKAYIDAIDKIWENMACQFNSAELVPTGQIDPYVQDALDLIEFANGSTDTQWGKLRAEMGHPAPFNLKMMGVGNENWGPQYVERLKIFTKAIKDKYPGFKLVNSSGTDPSGDRFDYLNGELRKMNADLIDEHYYRSPEWFLSNARRYDNYPRTGSKVFAGEYASHCDDSFVGAARNNWKAALSEAAFMTGLERNADVVSMRGRFSPFHRR